MICITLIYHIHIFVLIFFLALFLGEFLIVIWSLYLCICFSLSLKYFIYVIISQLTLELEPNRNHEEFNVEGGVGGNGEENTNKTSLFLDCTSGYINFVHWDGNKIQNFISGIHQQS